MTLIQAQDRYIQRVNSCHAGHRNRVSRAAWRELGLYAEQRGMNARQVCIDAKDMAELERNAED